MAAEDVVTKAGKRRTEVFDYSPWTFTVTRSSILESVCRSCGDTPESSPCTFCSVTKALRSLPQWPEMLFAENSLSLKHSSGTELYFNAVDALLKVKLKEDSVKVAMTEAWKAARSDCEYIESKTAQPYDWTFTTDYKGTLIAPQEVAFRPATEGERINYQKLKEREKILFYSELDLYEDELGDNGASAVGLKIRAMPSCLFILMRFYLRVDHVLIRVHDTRYYFEQGSTKLVREFSRRESKITDLKVPPEVLIDRNAIAEKLSLLEETVDVLDLTS